MTTATLNLGENNVRIGASSTTNLRLSVEENETEEKSFINRYFDRYAKLVVEKPKSFLLNPVIKGIDIVDTVGRHFIEEASTIKQGPVKGIYDTLSIAKGTFVFVDVVSDVQKIKDCVFNTIDVGFKWITEPDTNQFAKRRVELWTGGLKDLVVETSELIYDASESIEFLQKIGATDFASETLGVVGVVGAGGTIVGSTIRIGHGIYNLATMEAPEDLPVGVDPEAIASMKTQMAAWSLARSVFLFAIGLLTAVVFVTGAVIAPEIYLALTTLILITNIATGWLGAAEKEYTATSSDYIAKIVL